MSDNALGAMSTETDYMDSREEDQHSGKHDPGPAESAAEAAAIMGISEDTNANVSSVPNFGAGVPDAASASAPTGANGSSAPPPVSGASPTVASVAAPIVDTAKQQAQKALEQTKSAAGDALGQAKQKTTSWVETQLDMAADSLHQVSDAVRKAGQQFSAQDPNLHQIADVASTAANTVEGISTRLRDATVDEIITETESFARRQPSLFIGGVFALGFVLARFLKSTGGGGTGASVTPSTDRTLPVPLDQEPQMGQAGR